MKLRFYVEPMAGWYIVRDRMRGPRAIAFRYRKRRTAVEVADALNGAFLARTARELARQAAA